MKRLVTLLIILLTTIGTTNAQRLNYDNNSKWFWGLNMGGAWNTTDVQNKTDVGYGFTLGKSLNYNYGKRMTFDLRGRYLRGFWYGQDFDSTNFSVANATLSSGATNYKDSLGFAVNNFKGDVHDVSLELVLHANGVRERTGFDPYVFGGIGATFSRTKGNLLNSASGDAIYAYDELNPLNEASITGLLDESYETALDGNSNSYNAYWTPSVGFGLGYYFGNRFSIGVEHRTTFTLNDEFDGYSNPAGKRENDVYHYTNGYFKWYFKRGRGGTYNGGGVNTNTNNTNNLTNCQTPIIQFLAPQNNNMTVGEMLYHFTASVDHVASRQSIQLIVNGAQNTNFIYNTQTKRIEADLYLVNGVNTIEIVATNGCGTDRLSRTITYTRVCDTPVISIINPTNAAVIDNPAMTLRANVQGVANRSNIQVTMNGQAVNSFTFNAQTGDIFYNTRLIQGTNTFEINAMNDCGLQSQVVTVTHQVPCAYPVISLINPQANTIVNKSAMNLRFRVDNITSNKQVKVEVNGKLQIPGIYRTGDKSYTVDVNLGRGVNTILITVTNDCGTTTETITVIYEAPVNPVNPVTPVEEKIKICHYPPGNTGNPQTLEIPLSAWPAHQAHGDKLGPCPVVEEPVVEEKVTICHYPPGNNANPQTLEIPLSAWPAHQAHGDKLGPCPEVEKPHVDEPVVEEKVTICHIPPGNNGKPQTIEIPLSAWPAHQAHGDKLGPCPEVDKPHVDKPVHEEKVTICHYPPGNNGNPQTLEIPLSAWPAHQKHGDKLGPCPEVETPSIDEPVVEEKVTICHIPPGNNGNPQTIEIPLSAWPAHQAHGDKLGPCPEVDKPGGVKPADEEKITICHYPPGNNGNPQTLEIPLRAWPAHQKHGDKLGPCPETENPENGNPGDGEPSGNEKITICHYPPGNTDNPQTIEIPLSAWPAHQAHGDKLGPCDDSKPGNNGNQGNGGNSGNQGNGNNSSQGGNSSTGTVTTPGNTGTGATVGGNGDPEVSGGNNGSNGGNGNNPSHGGSQGGSTSTGTVVTPGNSGTGATIGGGSDPEVSGGNSGNSGAASGGSVTGGTSTGTGATVGGNGDPEVSGGGSNLGTGDPGQRDAQREAEEAARRKAEEEQKAREAAARQKAQQEQKAREEAARQKAEREQKAKEEAARIKAENEQKAREEAARLKAAQEKAKADAEEAARKKAEEQKRKAEAEAKKRAEEEKKAKELEEKAKEEQEKPKTEENPTNTGRSTEIRNTSGRP